jgi:hypothetical protein
LSIVQGPFSVAPCQTLILISRFATFSSPDNDGAHEPLAECARGAPLDTDTPLELSLQVRPTLANGRVAERPCRRRGDAEPA